MKISPRTFILLPLLLSFSAQAEDLCESRASIHKHVTYCDDNWDFLPPAQTCVQDFTRLAAAEKDRFQKLLNSQIEAAKDDNKQQLDFNTNGELLLSSLDEVSYLLDYGKQVHTELEDYVYSLVLPIYDDEDRGDPLDPKVKARFMESECYSDPVQMIEGMELQLRPQIEQLEKAKAQLLSLQAITKNRSQNLDAKGTLVQVKRGVAAAGTPKLQPIPKGKSDSPQSTITGNLKKDDLP